MMPRTGARDAILRSIRDNLAASAPYDAVVHLGPPDVRRPESSARKPLPIASSAASRGSEYLKSSISSTLTLLKPARLFAEQAAGVGASCDIVADESEAIAAIRRVLSSCGARRIIGSDTPLVQRAIAAISPDLETRDIADVSREDLFACDAGITTAQLAIAETGTLVLESAREKNRLLSLVPPIHIALLAADDICDSLSQVIQRLQESHRTANVASHAVTFITGPSRTSDIELTLTIGVHGPRTLHIIILESPA
jgi:L-lactate dehydrogenase complex protein LldG